METNLKTLCLEIGTMLIIEDQAAKHHFGKPFRCLSVEQREYIQRKLYGGLMDEISPRSDKY